MKTVDFKTSEAAAIDSGAMEEVSTTNTTFVQNPDRREFLGKLLAAGMALFAARCGKPVVDDEPDNPNKPDPNKPTTTVDNRSNETLRHQIALYINGEVAKKNHPSYEAALADVSKYIEDLLLDKKYDIGKFSKVNGIFGKSGDGKVNFASADFSEVTSNSTCKKRVATKGFEEESTTTIQYFHEITCDEK